MIDWTCQRCGCEIYDGDGYVTVNEDRIAEHPGQMVAWEAEVLANAGIHARFSPIHTPLAPEPPRVAWDVLHRACDPQPERPDYWIPVERLRTPVQLALVTAELLDGTDWVAATNWTQLLRHKLHG